MSHITPLSYPILSYPTLSYHIVPPTIPYRVPYLSFYRDQLCDLNTVLEAAGSVSSPSGYALDASDFSSALLSSCPSPPLSTASFVAPEVYHYHSLQPTLFQLYFSISSNHLQIPLPNPFNYPYSYYSYYSTTSSRNFDTSQSHNHQNINPIQKALPFFSLLHIVPPWRIEKN